MTDPIDPLHRVNPPQRAGERRGEDRRAAQRRAREEQATASNLPVPVGPVHDHEPAPPPVSPGAFAAQLLGQGGEKRGLRGGPPVLDGARAAYLEAEFSGANDRRPPKGRITKTEI